MVFVFWLNRFQPIVRVANKSQEKFTTLQVPFIGFLCFLDSDKILLLRIWLENKGLIMFCKISCLNQSEL